MRGRKSRGIKKITNKDRNLLIQIARTGLATKYHAKEYLNYNERRLEKMVYSGYLIKSLASSTKNGVIVVYKLNTQGKSYIKNYCLEVNNLYHFASLTHDYRLTDIYYGLSEEEKDTWKTEGDYRSFGFRKGAPDATIQRDGKVIALEVITKNYTEEDIELKEIFVDSYNMELEIYGA